MNVLSLFDGMSCGQQALERAGIKIDNYFASEIDKYAIQVTMANYPNTIQLGSVINVDGYQLPKIDLLIGGSPCQSFSFAGKRKGMSTKCEIEILTLDQYLNLKAECYEFEGQSYLFWEFIRLLNEVKPKYFLLENVMMGEKWERILSNTIGLNPIEINSALVSAQNRRRLYWTNIGLEPGGLFGYLESTIKQPKDKGILLKDILESEVDEKYFLSDKCINKITKTNNGQRCFETLDKSLCLAAGYHKQGRDNQYIVAMRGREAVLTPKRTEYGKSIRKDYEAGNIETQRKNIQQLEPRTDGKTNTITSVQKDNLVYTENYIQLPGYRIDNQVFYEDNKHGTLDTHPNRPKVLTEGKIRRLTPLECMRLQTVKDDYLMPVSDTQKYRMLGNGWTIDVIAHIFSYLK